MIEYYEKFEPFFGNNSNRVVDPGITRGGGVSLTRHMGKPLTQSLWEDLTERLEIQEIRIYGPGDFQWTIGFLLPGAFIELDKDGNVEEISLWSIGR